MKNPKQTSLLTANLICMASMLIWAASLPAADHIIPLLSPEHLSAVRMVPAAIFLILVWALWEGLGPLRRTNWIRGIAVGALISLSAWFMIKGQAIGGAVTAAVISSTMPIVGIALEVAFDGRKITLALILGLVLSILGALLALDSGTDGLSLGWGALFCFAFVLSFTLGSRLTVTRFPKETSLGRTAVTMTGAAITAATVTLVQTASGTPLPGFDAWGLTEALALLLYSIGALGVSQLFWLMSIERLGIGLSALHINAAPFYVMLILFALGGSWNWPQAGAAALVALGVLIAQGLIPLSRTPR